jgi:hypothetical protein
VERLSTQLLKNPDFKVVSRAHEARMSGIATATSSPTPSSATNPIAHLSLASVAQYLGLAAAIFYLLGLIIVSASLGRFATMNRRLFDVQYIPAGILFAVLVGMYLSFMKLFLFEAESVVWNVQKAGGPTGSPLLWGFTGFLFQLLGMVFCLSSNAANFISVYG